MKSLEKQSFHGLKIKGFIKAFDDPNEFNINNLNIKKLGNEDDINKVIKSEKIEDIIIALDKPTPERIMSAIVSINGVPLSIKILPFWNLFNLKSIFIIVLLPLSTFPKTPMRFSI